MRTTYTGNIKPIFQYKYLLLLLFYSIFNSYLMDNSLCTPAFLKCINQLGTEIFLAFERSGKYIKGSEIDYELLTDNIQFLLSLCVHGYESVRKLANQMLFLFLDKFPEMKFKRKCVCTILELCHAISTKYDDLLFAPHILTDKIYVPSLQNALDLPSNRNVLKSIMSTMEIIVNKWLVNGFDRAPQKMAILLNSFINIMPKSTLPGNHNTGIGIGTSLLAQKILNGNNNIFDSLSTSNNNYSNNSNGNNGNNNSSNIPSQSTNIFTRIHHSNLNWYIGELELQGYYLGLLSSEIQHLYLKGDSEPYHTITLSLISKYEKYLEKCHDYFTHPNVEYKYLYWLLFLFLFFLSFFLFLFLFFLLFFFILFYLFIIF